MPACFGMAGMYVLAVPGGPVQAGEVGHCGFAGAVYRSEVEMA
jgi:hypothetical protein